MTIDLFDPQSAGFPLGSPIFKYPPRARKLVNEAFFRIRGSSNYLEFWQRVLTPQERDELGGDLDKCAEKHPGCVDLLCQLREAWGRERVIVEIAYVLGHISTQNYDWIRQLSGEEIPTVAFTPVWNRETGRLEFGGKLCRKISVHLAKKIVPTLDEFQKQGWPRGIAYEFLTDDPQEIHQTSRNLNRNMEHVSFHVANKQICWRSVSN